jgi:starvation-inducible DNA-binding protein
MAFEIFPNGSHRSITPSSNASDKPDGERYAALTRWLNDLAEMHIVLARTTRAESVVVLNQILADTMTLRDLYKKHHGQTSGAALYLLFDRHHSEQEDLIDAITERVRTLGGMSIATAADVAETTMLARPPRDCEGPFLPLAQLIDAHERVLYGVRAAACRAAALGDDGTNDLLVSDVIRTNEKQAWSVQEQLRHAALHAAARNQRNDKSRGND